MSYSRGMQRLRRSVVAVVLICISAASGQADPGDSLDTGGGGVAKRYVNHARAAMEEGRLTEAIEYCDRAISEYPAYIRAHFDKGRALMAAGHYTAAIDEFTTVIAAHPEYPMVYGYRGDAELRQGNADAAVADLNKAVLAQLGIGSVMYANVLAIRSLAWEKLGEGAPAAEDFNRAMKAITGDNFNDYKVLNHRCYTAALAGLLDSAVESCDELVSRHARDEGVYDTRGLVDLKTKQWDKAVADYTQALYYRPDLTTSLYGRGVAKIAKGDTAGGNADMTEARANEPHIAEIMQRLGAQK